jgi:competence protein ComEC
VVIATEGVGACATGCLSGVFLGDLGEESQRRLLGLGGLSRVDVVKVAHHGSADQSADLYERLAATAGVIGVGVDNGYGHPTASALAILESAHTAALRTDERGLILLAPGSAAGSVVVWSQRPG